MTITEEQFLRGVAAVERYRAMKDEIDAAMSAGGCNLDGLAGDGLLDELTDQISERCNDKADDVCGTMLDWLLYEGGGDCTEADGTVYSIKTPADLWTYWEATKSGPFDSALTAALKGDEP